MSFLSLAWRNIWRNRRRTILTTMAIAFSLFITLVMLSMQDGSHDNMLKISMEYFTGYIQIHEKGYQDDPDIQKSFEDTGEIGKILENNGNVRFFSPRLQSGALIGNANNSYGSFLVGMEPEMEKNVTIVHKKIVKGEFLSKGDTMECVIGEKLADNLQAEVGSPVVIMVQAMDGSTGALKFDIKGIFKTGTDELDMNFVYISLEDAQNLLFAEDKINSIAIVTTSPKNIYTTVAQLKDSISSDYEVLGWKELMPELVQFINLDDIFSYIIFGMLMLVVVFGILSAVFTSILERTSEFGILLALGTRPEQVRRLVMAETLMITSIGLIAGSILAIGGIIYGYNNPVNLPSEFAEMTAQYGMENKLYFSIYPVKLLLAALSMVVITLIFSYYPAWKASVMKPDKAIRNINQ